MQEVGAQIQNNSDVEQVPQPENLFPECYSVSENDNLGNHATVLTGITFSYSRKENSFTQAFSHK